MKLYRVWFGNKYGKEEVTTFSNRRKAINAFRSIYEFVSGGTISIHTETAKYSVCNESFWLTYEAIED